MQLTNDYFEGNDIDNGYERVLFLPRVLQTQELNGIQAILEHKIKTPLVAIFKDGEVISGQWSFDGKVLITKDLILFLEGNSYKVADLRIEVASGEKYISADLKKIVVSSEDNQALLDPVDGENHHEPGALRLKGVVSLSPSHDPKNAIFKMEGNTLVKAKIGSLSANAYDLIIDLNSDVLPSFENIKYGSRIFIRSINYRLSSPIKIAGHKVQIQFSNDSLLIIEDPSVLYFFEIHGSVKINGCRLGLKGKALEEKQKIKIASVPKGSRIYMHDYTVSDLAPRSYDGEGIFQHNVVWEEGLE